MFRKIWLSVKMSNLHISHHHFLVAVSSNNSPGFLESPAVAPRFLAEEKVVDVDILQQGQEHEEQAHKDVDVNGFDTGNMGEFIPHM